MSIKPQHHGLAKQWGTAIFLLVLLLFVSEVDAREETLPLAARITLIKAQGFIETKEYEKALSVLIEFNNKAKQTAPDKKDKKGYRHHMIFFTIGNCYLLMEKSDAAIPYYQQAVAKIETFSGGWLNLAKCAFDTARYPLAAVSFIRGYETAEKPSGEYLYYAAVSHMAANDYVKAIAVFDRILSHHPGEMKTSWKIALVQTYLSLNRPKKALPVIETLSKVTTGKEKKRWQEIRLHQYLSLQMEKKALAYVKELIGEYPCEPKWWKGLANLYLNAEQYKKALVALTIKGFVAPLSEDEKSVAADISLALGIPISAARLYEEIIETSEHPEIYYKLSQSYLRLYQPEKALACIEQRTGGKETPRLTFLKGRILFELGRFELAVIAFEQAARHKEMPGQAWLMAGYAAWHHGDVGRAKNALDHAVRYKNQKKAAQRALYELKEATPLSNR